MATAKTSSISQNSDADSNMVKAATMKLANERTSGFRTSFRECGVRFGKTPWVIPVGIVAVVIIGVVVSIAIFTGNGDGDGPDGSGLDLPLEDRIELVRLSQQANVALENEHFPIEYENDRPVSGYEFAERSYVVIQEKLADESLPTVNLAICRYVYATKTKFDPTPEGQAAKDEATKRAEEAISEWLERSPDEAAAHWLLGSYLKWQQLGQTTPEIMEAFEKAAELAPNNQAFQYAVYKAAQTSDDPGIMERGERALQRAYEIHPENIVIALDLAYARASNQDASLNEMIGALREDIAAIANQNNVEGTLNDPMPKLDELTNLLADEQWSRVRTNVAMIRNLVRGSPSYGSAIRRIDPDALEFMEQSLSDEFVASTAVETEASERIPVVFDASQPIHQLDSNEMIQQARFADFNMDNQLELFVLTESSLSVYEIASDISTPTLVTSFELPQPYEGLLIADLDRDNKVKPGSSTDPPETSELDVAISNEECDDADVDVILWGKNGMLVLTNELDRETQSRSFVVKEQSDEFNAEKGFTSGLLVDIEHDGDLDLVAANEKGIRIFLHLGADIDFKTLQFRPHTQFSDLPDYTSDIQSLFVVDWDRDVDADILVSDAEGTTLGYLENLRHGKFQWRSFSDELPELATSGPLALVEADGNASWDLIGKTDEGWRIALTQTSKAGPPRLLKTIDVSSQQQDGLCLPDYDNDGVQDLISWNETSVAAFRGQPDGSFVADPSAFPSDMEGIQEVLSADVDNDGDLDLSFVTADRVVTIANEGGNKNHWIVIRAIGNEDNAGRSNHHAIGSLIELRAGDRYQAQMVSVQRTHFGLGKHETPDVARTMWTNGMPQGIVDFETDTTICQKMYLKGSCPFIYTWTGEKYEFLTDCLWAAPLGLQFAEGVLAPSRSWEYLKIPGDRLVAIDGEYRIQLTEELWEAAYFDHVELICIDHPESVDIYSNEKVGPAEIAAYKVHTVSDRRIPVSATDQNGNDLSSLLAARDDQYVRGFEERIRQGLTTPHLVELDLGEVSSDAEITLFMTGWIHPTDTSLNIAFSQNPEVDGPRLPELWVADGAGGWQAVDRPIGFPGGKTKTIAIDLTGVFPSDEHRIQLRTTAEIYWDEAFFTENEPTVDLHTQKLSPCAADLHFRGFSQRFPKSKNSPERFDYSIVELDPKWPPMRGSFTRYGDVTELLLDEDDRMAILASGDEMTVRFKVPAEDPPPGWKRDFFLYCVGWDKDADLNTVYGQTVEPLPHQAMQSYPYGPENAYPDSEVHRKYLDEYQTRKSSFGYFWNAVRK